MKNSTRVYPQLTRYFAFSDRSDYLRVGGMNGQELRCLEELGHDLELTMLIRIDYIGTETVRVAEP